MTSGSTAASPTTDEFAAASPGTVWGAADRLRAVRRAHERFLALWAVDRLLDDPAATGRAWADAADPYATPDNRRDAAVLPHRLFGPGRLDD